MDIHRDIEREIDTEEQHVNALLPITVCRAWLQIVCRSSWVAGGARALLENECLWTLR